MVVGGLGAMVLAGQACRRGAVSITGWNRGCCACLGATDATFRRLLEIDAAGMRCGMRDDGSKASLLWFNKAASGPRNAPLPTPSPQARPCQCQSGAQHVTWHRGELDVIDKTCRILCKHTAPPRNDVTATSSRLQLSFQ